MNKYIIRQHHFEDKGKQHYYYIGEGKAMDPFDIRINQSFIFEDRTEAEKIRRQLLNDYEDLEIVAVKLQITPIRAK
jgi:hypothetical protein